MISIWYLQYVLPEAALLIFLCMRERNIKRWSYIAWGAVLFPGIICALLFGLSYAYTIANVISAISYGFVYYFGFTDKNNATYTRKVVKPATATAYLEEYKRKRLNGGK